jgi:3-hydroxymyristoyl/3-hydroxydecanoyl-(acyl carrier protein) dehydratase
MIEHTLHLPIAADHPAYAGHFPGRPILPGVVLLDAVLHALTMRHGMAGKTNRAQFKSAKFLNPVRPGETLTLHYAESPTGGFRFEIRCLDGDGRERGVASGSVVFSAATAA